MNLIKIIFFLIDSISAASINSNAEEAAKTEAFIIDCCINPELSPIIDKYLLANQDDESQKEAFIIDCCLDSAYTPSIENHVPGRIPSGKHDKVFCFLREGTSIPSPQKPVVLGSAFSAFSPVIPKAKAENDLVVPVSSFDSVESSEISESLSSSNLSPSETINTQNLLVDSVPSSPLGHYPVISPHSEAVTVGTDTNYNVVQTVSTSNIPKHSFIDTKSSSKFMDIPSRPFNCYKLIAPPRKVKFISAIHKFNQISTLLSEKQLQIDWTVYALVPSTFESFGSVQRKSEDSPKFILRIWRRQLSRRLNDLNKLFEDEVIYSAIRLIWLKFDEYDAIVTIHFNENFHSNDMYIRYGFIPFF